MLYSISIITDNKAGETVEEVVPEAVGIGQLTAGYLKLCINILVLDINCQHFGNVCQLEGFCAPFGRRVGEYVWSVMYIFLYVYLYWI